MYFEPSKSKFLLAQRLLSKKKKTLWLNKENSTLFYSHRDGKLSRHGLCKTLSLPTVYWWWNYLKLHVYNLNIFILKNVAKFFFRIGKHSFFFLNYFSYPLEEEEKSVCFTAILLVRCSINCKHWTHMEKQFPPIPVEELWGEGRIYRTAVQLELDSLFSTL